MKRLFDCVAVFWVVWRVLDEAKMSIQAKRDGDRWRESFTPPQAGRLHP